MGAFFAALGAAVAMAGGDKLAGLRGYRNMFHHLGWSDAEMRAAATAELAGGLLMMPRKTRPMGGALVAAASAAVLATELRKGNPQLAIPRGLILLLALAATGAGSLRGA